MVEHVAFKRGLVGYDVRIYDQARLLPPGLAAIGSSVLGVVGAILGMAQFFFTGPIAKLVDDERGGDVGLELAFVFAGLSYLGLRKWEVKVFKR
jgi:purine-cytosine permease-like protein